jgi:hypothetical protein
MSNGHDYENYDCEGNFCFYPVTVSGLFVCLFTVIRLAEEFFTYMETSPLPVKGCKFMPMLGAQQFLNSLLHMNIRMI